MRGEIVPKGPTIYNDRAPILPTPIMHPVTDSEKLLPFTLKEMTHWTMIFPAASVEFQSMPDITSTESLKPEYDIRIARTWVEVDGKLKAAQSYYTDKTGYRGRFWNAWRWGADNITEPLSLAIKLVPQMDIVTPVLGAVQIVLDAVKTGAAVREKSLEGLEDMDDLIADVEMFVRTFLHEQTIEKKAVRLMAAVLLAVERLIRFWTRPGLIRASRTLLQGKDYEEKLLNSLESILIHSKKLMAEGVKSHIKEFHAYSKATHKILELIKDNQDHLVEEVKVSVKKLNELSGKAEIILDSVYNFGRGMNAHFELLFEKLEENKRNQDAERQRHRRETASLLKKNQQSEEKLSGVNEELAEEKRKTAYLTGVLRSVSPMRDSPFAPPPDSLVPMMRQEWLYDFMHVVDIETNDMDLIEEGRGRIALQDQAQVESILHSSTFEEWIVSPGHDKLLIHGNFSGFMMQTSALSLFCTTLTKSSRAKPDYIGLVWFCGRNLEDEISDSETDDDVTDWGENFDESYEPGAMTGTIRTMLRSLIAQLIYYHDFGMTNLLHPGADMFLVEQGDIEELCKLFVWLVRQLPQEVTLFCLIDGIIYYERDEYEDPMLDAMGPIIGLTTDESILATIKILITSPWPTSTIRVAFEDEAHTMEASSSGDGRILSMELLPRVELAPSIDRIVRELGLFGHP